MILLDTHVAVMLALRPEGISRVAARAIAHARARDGLAIASITMWEVALLIDQQQLRIPGTTESFLTGLCGHPDLKLLDITPEIATLAFRLPPGFPHDPADRLIVATARAHGVPLVTRDRRIQDSGVVKTIW